MRYRRLLGAIRSPRSSRQAATGGVAIWLMTVAVLVGCTAPENEGGTAIPGAQSGAPLADEAISPSDQEAEIDE